MARRSKGEYPPDWPAIAQAVKVAAGWRCVRCNEPHDRDRGFVLTVHHLDLDPSNCRWWNLVALCQRCHLSIQQRVVLERVWLFGHSEWFRAHVAGYYASINGLPDDRDFVAERIDWLIALGQGRATATAKE